MNELVKQGDISRAESRRDSLRLAGAVSSPILVPLVPAAVLAAIGFMTAGIPAIGLSIFLLSGLWLVIGFVLGLVMTAVFLRNRSRWKKELKERIVQTGIRTRHVELFRRELRSHEKRALKEIEERDPLLGDAYRETLASRLTSSKILKLTDLELADANRRKDRVKRISSSDARELIEEIENDIGRLWTVRRDAERLLADSELRLEKIEATSRRGTTLSDAESSLKNLSERSAQLPLALEAARMREEVMRDLDNGLDVVGTGGHSPSSS
jgi:hypothetical protein